MIADIALGLSIVSLVLWALLIVAIFQIKKQVAPMLKYLTPPPVYASVGGSVETEIVSGEVKKEG